MTGRRRSPAAGRKRWSQQPRAPVPHVRDQRRRDRGLDLRRVRRADCSAIAGGLRERGRRARATASIWCWQTRPPSSPSGWPASGSAPRSSPSDPRATRASWRCMPCAPTPRLAVGAASPSRDYPPALRAGPRHWTRTTSSSARSRSTAHGGIASPACDATRRAILFTSGTTSAPKGVVITQAGYAFAGDAMAAAAALRTERSAPRRAAAVPRERSVLLVRCRDRCRRERRRSCRRSRPLASWRRPRATARRMQASLPRRFA